MERIIIHCSATPAGRDVKAETIRQWHLDRGWRDIGYHIVIELDGSVHLGRAFTEIGAHTYGYNAGSIGICYVGGTDTDGQACDTRTDAQRVALRAVVATLKGIYPEATVHGHNEFSNKACPSFDVQTEL